MKYSVVNSSDIKTIPDFRIDAEYWHPELIRNSNLISDKIRIKDFLDTNISNIKSSPIKKSFDYLEISKISLNSNEYQTTQVEHGEEPDRAHYILKKGDVAVSTVRPNRNAVALIRKDNIIGSSGLSVLRSKKIEAEYLFAFCKTNYFINCLIRADKATMYPAVSNTDIYDVPLLIPSQSLRLLIVQAVHNSLHCIDNAHNVNMQAQSFLLGELGLSNWRPEHQLTFVKNYSETKQAQRIDAEYYQPKYEEIVNYIKSYKGGWDTLGNLVSIKKCIEVGSNEYLDEGIPFIRVSNLSPLQITEDKYITENLYEKIKQHQPKKGEILFSKDATPGIAYYLHETPPKMILSSGILRLNNKSDKINSEYLTLVLNSILVKEQANRDVGGSIILHWRPDQIKNVIIPILPMEVQNQIQQKVTEAFDLHNKSKLLLAYAKRVVEIAIEQDEKTAIEWLENKTSTLKP